MRLRFLCFLLVVLFLPVSLFAQTVAPSTMEGAQALSDSASIRRTALTMKVPYYTTMAGAAAVTQAIAALREGVLDVRPLQAYA